MNEYERRRTELVDWITAYKDAAELNALAEDPDESADYLLSLEWLAVLADNQELPEIKVNKYIPMWGRWGLWFNRLWRGGQLNYKLRLNNNWKRIVKNEKRT